MATPVALETARVRMRQWAPEDRVAFAALNADPRVMAFFPAPLERAASDAMADRCERLIAARGWGLWAVETKTTREFIGFVGLNVPTCALPFSPCVEIGWRIAFAHWGRGLATEAARAALRFGFDTLELTEIVSFTAVPNRRSQSVMQRLGMQPAAETFEHPNIAAGHPLRTHCLYRLSREAWSSQVARDQSPASAR